MAKKKKHTVSPEAAKILEQYRNAGKPQPPANGDGSPEAPGDEPAKYTPARAPNPGASATRQRSGTRGK